MDLAKTLYHYFKQHKELFGSQIFLQNSLLDTPDLNQTLGKLKESKLEKYRISVCLCEDCNLHKTRKNFVFGAGDSDAELMLIGEAPGETEDLEGNPFVGRSGKLLDKILSAISRKRDNGVYITNIIKCRPPGNRNPLQTEISKCKPYLLQQINIVKPKIILALGSNAGNALLNNNLSIKNMRRKTYIFEGTPLKVTYHPAALLRNPDLKKPAWEDFKWVRDYIEGIKDGRSK